MRVVAAVAAAVGLTLAGLGRELRAEPWSARAPLAEPRQEVAVAELGGRIYAIGGFRGDLSVADTVEVYDPEADAWSFAAPLPTPVHHAAAAAVGGRLYAIGGWSDLLFQNPLDAVYAYDPEADGWQARAPMPTARGALAAAVVDGRIYAAGGSPNARERDFAAYDPARDSWEVLPSMPTPRNHLAAGAMGGRFYAAGGRGGFGIAGILSVLEEYDPLARRWSAKSPMPTARGGIAGASLGRLLIVFGGEGNDASASGTFEEVEAYDSSLDAWLSLAPMPTPRHGIGAAAVEGRVHLPGGAPVQGFGVTGAHEVYDSAAELVLDCADGRDNDGDGLVDAPEDYGCTGPEDPTEQADCESTPDADGDGVGDACDNCIEARNAGQFDGDADGYGNACDADLDNDGSVGFLDLGRLKAVFFTGDPEADLNADGAVDFLDLGRMKAQFFRAPGPSAFVPEPTSPP